MQRFDDRRIIVTGAGSGIGQATVARLLDEGGTVVAFDVSIEGLARTTAAAEDAGTGRRLTTAVLDTSDEVAVGNEVATAINTLDGLDVLVNAAAIQICAHTHEHTLHDWNATLAINLTGTFLMTRSSLPALIDSGRGVVINFTSTAATFAHPYMAAYAASKGGVLAFTHSLALEYSKQGLRAVNIQPGGVSTALANSTLDKMPEGYDLGLWAKQTPLLHGRDSEILGDPSAVASVIAMVASDDGAFITGTEIRVDGGAHASRSTHHDRTRLPRRTHHVAVRRRLPAVLVGDAVLLRDLRADERMAGQLRQVRISIQRIDQMPSELRGFGVLGRLGQHVRMPVEGGTEVFGEQYAHPDRHSRHPGLAEVDGHVGGQLVHTRLLRTVGRTVHVAHRSRRRRERDQASRPTDQQRRGVP